MTFTVEKDEGIPFYLTQAERVQDVHRLAKMRSLLNISFVTVSRTQDNPASDFPTSILTCTDLSVLPFSLHSILSCSQNNQILE